MCGFVCVYVDVHVGVYVGVYVGVFVIIGSFIFYIYCYYFSNIIIFCNITLIVIMITTDFVNVHFEKILLFFLLFLPLSCFFVLFYYLYYSHDSIDNDN